jgi:integrase
MGSVYQRGRRWWLSYWRDGQQFAESSKSEVREDALRLLKQRLGELATNTFRPPEKILISELLALVVQDYHENEKKSLRDVKNRIRSQVSPAFGSLRADRLTTGRVRKFIADRRRHVSNGTVNRELAVLKRALSLGAQHDPPLVTKSVYIPHLKEANPRSGFVDDAQYRKLRDELPDHLKLLLVLAYHLGCRKGELLSLRWNQIDRRAKQIRLNPGETKSGPGRLLPIYGEMAAFIEMQRTRSRKLGKQSTWVFTDGVGNLIQSFYKAWKSACDRAGLDGQLFHDLRRSAVRNMERGGISRRVAMQITGHRTESIYARYDIVNERDVMEAGKALERRFSRTSAKPLQSTKISEVPAASNRVN